jgi:hypothetical protein
MEAIQGLQTFFMHPGLHLHRTAVSGCLKRNPFCLFKLEISLIGALGQWKRLIAYSICNAMLLTITQKLFGWWAVSYLFCFVLNKCHAVQHVADMNVVYCVIDHELWWLENILGHRNPDTDTPEVILKVISALIDDILNGDVVGAYYYEHAPASPEGGKQLPVLFTHGGISPEYYGFLEKKSAEFKAWRKSGGNVAEFLADHITAGLRDAVAHTCTLINYRNPNSQVPKCTMKGELFAAGKERGGGPIGGPFWSGKHTYVIIYPYLVRSAYDHSFTIFMKISL